MISPLRNCKPPFELPSDIVYFHDWRYVQHGNVGWRAEDGRRPPMWTTDPVPPMRYEPRFLPVGIRLVDLPGERIGIPLAATPVPHKHPRLASLGALAWAWWPKGRLVALEAETEGQLTLQPIKTAGRRMRLNFRTPLAGRIRVELLDARNRPIPGRTFADCDWLCGDELDREVTWKGDPDLGHAAESLITACFQLRCARLFSVSFA